MQSIALVLLLLLTHGFLAAEDVLIKNARIFDGDRVIPRASVLVRDGKIQQVGLRMRAPKNVHLVAGPQPPASRSERAYLAMFIRFVVAWMTSTTVPYRSCSCGTSCVVIQKREESHDSGLDYRHVWNWKILGGPRVDFTGV